MCRLNRLFAVCEYKSVFMLQASKTALAVATANKHLFDDYKHQNL